MSKRNEEAQRVAVEYWKKLEAGGMAYEFTPETLVVGSFRDGLLCEEKAHRGEIRDLIKTHNKALKECCEEIAGLKIKLEIAKLAKGAT
jgi:hypothetical protein